MASNAVTTVDKAQVGVVIEKLMQDIPGLILQAYEIQGENEDQVNAEVISALLMKCTTDDEKQLVKLLAPPIVAKIYLILKTFSFTKVESDCMSCIPKKKTPVKSPAAKP